MMKTKAIVLAMGVLLTSACSTEVQVNQVAQESKKETRDFIGKVSAPIEMTYQLSKDKYAVGENIDVQIVLTSNVKKPISTKMNANKNLKLLSRQTQWQSDLNKSGMRENQPVVQLMAEKEGTFYLDFVASVEVDGRMMGKAFSIPVQVGNKLSKQADNYVVDEKGQKVKAFKLKENN